MNDTPISEQEATRRLDTVDFETIDTTAPLPELNRPFISQMQEVPMLPLPAAGGSFSFGQLSLVSDVVPSDEPEPTPFALELIRRQAAEIEKLQSQIDAANGRLNEIFARIEKYNRGASHKL